MCAILGGWSSWSYGVMVSTLDFESSDPGSNPGRTSFLSRGWGCRRLVFVRTPRLSSLRCMCASRLVDRESGRRAGSERRTHTSHHRESKSGAVASIVGRGGRVGVDWVAQWCGWKCVRVVVVCCFVVVCVGSGMICVLYGRRLRSYGVMVSTLDSESSDPGSNPGRTSFLCLPFRTPTGASLVFCVHCGRRWLLARSATLPLSRSRSRSRSPKQTSQPEPTRIPSEHVLSGSAPTE